MANDCQSESFGDFNRIVTTAIVDQNDFIDGFPSVRREQVIEYLKQAETEMERVAA